MNRLNKILLVVLLAQLALTALVWRSSTPEAPEPPRPLVAGFDATKVTKLVLHADKSSAPGATTTPPLELVKRGEGWVVASSYDYPAQAAPILELLGKLGGLTHTGAIASSAARAKQLGVAEEDYQRKLVATLDGKEVTLLIGNPVGSRQTAVRLGGKSDIFAISGLSPWAVSTSLTTYVSTTYAEVPRDRVSKISIARAGQTLELVKDGAQWKASIDGTPLSLAAGESLDQAVIEEVLGQVSQVELSSVADPKVTLGNEKAVISVWTTAPEPAAGAAGAGAAAAAGAGSAAGSGGAVAGAAAPPASMPVSAAPHWVLAVYEQEGKYLAQRRGASHAVMVETSRLGTIVELGRAKLVKKESKAPGLAPTPAAPGALPAPAPAAPSAP